MPFDDCQSVVVARRGVLQTALREAKSARLARLCQGAGIIFARLGPFFRLVLNSVRISYDVERWRHVSVREAQFVDAASQS